MISAWATPLQDTACACSAGKDDPALPLPSYVGAVPPEGVEPWDWQKTWAALKAKEN